MSLAHALFASFYSSAFYRSVASGWGVGRALGLLLLALAIGWIVQIAAIQGAAQSWARTEAERVIAALPPLALRGGELEASPPGPHTIDLGGDAGQIVIDTSEAPGPMGEDVALHVTRTQVVAPRSELETRSFEIAELATLLERGDGPIEKDELRALVERMARWVPILMFPFAVLGELAYRVVAALMLAVAGLVLGNALGAGLDFGRLFVVSLVVLVPIVLVESLLYALGSPVPIWLGAAASVALLALALRAIAAPGSGASPGLPPALGE